MIGYIKKDNNCNILDKLLCKTIKSSYENGIEYKSVKFNKKLLKILMKDNIKTVVIAKKDKAEPEVKHFMSGVKGMLPTVFDVEPPSKKERKHQAEKPPKTRKVI